jgi:hypothetical protein
MFGRPWNRFQSTVGAGQPASHVYQLFGRLRTIYSILKPPGRNPHLDKFPQPNCVQIPKKVVYPVKWLRFRKSQSASFRKSRIGFVWRPRNWLRLVPPQTASFRKPQNGFVWQILKSASFGDPETGFVWHPPNWLSFGAPQMASFGEPRNWLRLANPEIGFVWRTPKLASFGAAQIGFVWPGPRSPAPGPQPPAPH